MCVCARTDARIWQNAGTDYEEKDPKVRRWPNLRVLMQHFALSLQLLATAETFSFARLISAGGAPPLHLPDRVAISSPDTISVLPIEVFYLARTDRIRLNVHVTSITFSRCILPNITITI